MVSTNKYKHLLLLNQEPKLYKCGKYTFTNKFKHPANKITDF